MPIQQNQQVPGAAVPQFGIDANAIRLKKIPLDNARSQSKIDITGTFLYVITASSKTALANIGFGEQVQDAVPFKEGQFISGLRFSQIYVTNTAQAGEYITVMYGVESNIGLKVNNPSSQYNNISVIKPTGLDTVADVALTAATVTLISAADSTRKEILITNLSTNAAVMRIGDSNTAAARGIEISPGQTVTLATTDAVYGYSVPGESVGVSYISD